jgi:hypothetical protein
MSPPGNGQPIRYHVSMSGHVKGVLQQLHQQARAAGRSKRFLAAVRQVIERLHEEPLNLGEPLYRLPALELLVFQAVVDFLVVDFSVHQARPEVFIRGFKLLG